MTLRFATAKARAIDALDELVAEFFGTGPRNVKRSRGAWYVPRPGSGSTPDQMAIWRVGARRGGWRDYSTGMSGDAIDLVAYVHEGAVDRDSRMRAVEWIEERFGLRQMSPEGRRRMEEAGARRRREAEAREEKRRTEAIERSRKAFYAASPVLAGTPVETYLSTRGIELAAVPNLSGALRFRADAEYWLAATRGEDGRKIAPGPKFPALVSAMTDAGGRLLALHYTFLAPDGRGKAPVEKAKLMWPETMGLVVRVTRGPSGLTCEEAARQGVAGVVGLTEGIEDALSAGLAFPALRMHAAGSLAGLASVPDMACASGWLVFKDNDWGKPQAEALFSRALGRLEGFGKPVEVVAVPADWGKDVNDALRG